MRFTKMEGLGNDYIFLNCLEGRPEDLPACWNERTCPIWPAGCLTAVSAWARTG